MKQYLAIFILITLGVNLNAQDKYAYFNQDIRHYLLKENRFKTDSVHYALFPYHPTDIKALNKRTENSTKGISEKSFDINNQFSAYPLMDLENGFDLSGNDHNLVLNNAVGAGFEWKTDKWYANGNYLFGYWQGNEALMATAENNEIIPGMGFARALGNNYMTHTAFGRIGYTPNHFFNFEIGRDRQFIGNGYRSMMLSDNTTAYPYFKIDTKVWKLRYTNIFSLMKDISNANGQPADYINKFTTTHYLSWRATNTMTFGIFESIIWQAKDTLLDRGFDINYLNPVIFYRPVEFAQGSADNAILGINGQFKITDNHHIYAQLVLDEFLLSELSADIDHLVSPNDTTLQYGWWANKFAFQIGYKYYNAFKIDGLDVQTELNIVRPFTYTHGSSLQNYAHFNQALAHPRGANFYEWVSFIRYQKNNWRISNQFIWSNYGTDENGVSYGADLYQPYQNRVGTYYHQIAQGLRHVLLYNDFKFTYILNQNINLELDLGYRFKLDESAAGNDLNNMIYVGLRTKLWNRYQDY